MQIYNSLDEVKEAGTIAPDSIVNADCLEAMKLIPDKSIDCIICDLPYGITACKWDIVIPFDLLWEQYKRIIKPNGAIVLFGSQPFTSALVMSNPKWFQCEWIWHKSKPSGVAFKNQPMRNHEHILVFGIPKTFNAIFEDREAFTKGSQKRFDDAKRLGAQTLGTYRNTKNNTTGMAETGKRPMTMQRKPTTIKRFGSVPNRFGSLHPTQKPIPLIEYLLKTYSIEGEIIVDNTAGSGTLAIACINTNRRYICIEKDPDYFEVMRNRIETHDPNTLATPKKTRKPKVITEGQLALFG